MPRFFFNLRNGEQVADEEGLILSDEEAARREAVRNAREIMAEDVRHGHLCLRDQIEIADEGGQTVTIIPFRDTIDIDG